MLQGMLDRDVTGQASEITAAQQEEAMMGGNLKLITRWHDVVRGTGVAVYEADTAEAISAYALNWNRSMDLDISVVVDDGAAREIGQAMEAGS